MNLKCFFWANQYIAFTYYTKHTVFKDLRRYNKPLPYKSFYVKNIFNIYICNFHRIRCFHVCSNFYLKDNTIVLNSYTTSWAYVVIVNKINNPFGPFSDFWFLYFLQCFYCSTFQYFLRYSSCFLIILVWFGPNIGLID